jgi:invasion protein IalB
MKRRLAASLFACLAATAASGQAGHEVVRPRAEVMYSGWFGQCSTSRIADVTCVMRREARSGSDTLLGFVAFGAVDGERFLTVGIGHATAPRTLFVTIDGARIPNGTIACRGVQEFCSIVLRVDDGLLDRLMNGSTLTVESGGKIEMAFPLHDFARSRRTIL